MTEIEQLLTGSLTALVEQAEKQTALIASLDVRLRLLEQQVAAMQRPVRTPLMATPPSTGRLGS